MAIPPVRRASFEWRIEESLADSFVKQLKMNSRPNDLDSLPPDLVLMEANIRSEPPPGSGYRLVSATYDANTR